MRVGEHANVARMTLLRPFLAAALVLILACPAHAQDNVRTLLNPVFTDHAVLQRDRPIAVWGQASPNERISVTLDGRRVIARADRAGAWRAALPAHGAGGPYTLEVRGQQGATQSLTDVLIGDVYLCSGQSNMEFETRVATNADTALGGAADDNLRLLNVTRRYMTSPQARLPEGDRWQVAARESVSRFSAVCYFFGRELRQSEEIPIGLIAASWGGTIIEAWMSEAALTRVGGYEDGLAAAALARRDPVAAQAHFTQAMNAWWAANDPGTPANWRAPDFDDSGWMTIAPEDFWESSGRSDLALFDGVAWYRTEFTLTSAQAAQSARLELGPADDIDTTYVNCVQVGAMAGWDQPRVYEIAPGTLREGRNLLATGVLDTGGGGGWWGPAEEKVLVLADGARVPLDGPWRYRISAQLADVEAAPRTPADGPNGYNALYNGMIAPLAPYGLRGALWYQGEANAGAPQDYSRLLPAFFADWRDVFEARDLHFFVAQLANFGQPVAAPARTSWGAIRDVQRRVVDADAHAALAVTIDVGDRFDIHPTQKLVVAQRMARAAEVMIYGHDVAYRGPSPTRAEATPGSIRVRYENGPLVAYSAAQPIGFELCDEARMCRFADAMIEGEDVVIDAASGSYAFVRYCWGDAPICNLYNSADLPAVPFEIEVR